MARYYNIIISNNTPCKKQNKRITYKKISRQNLNKPHRNGTYTHAGAETKSSEYKIAKMYSMYPQKNRAKSCKYLKIPFREI